MQGTEIVKDSKNRNYLDNCSFALCLLIHFTKIS